LGFDIPYMIARAKMNMCIFDFDKQGFHKFAHAKERIIKWSSSAYKNQEFEFLDAEGRVYVDLLPLVKRDFKFNNYKLKTISEYFIGETKDPLTAKGIFKCYRIGIKKDKNQEYNNKAQRAMGIVGKYCVQDSVLVVRLMDKLKTWVGLTEMASVCNVPIFSLYTQGQQIKVFSQLYKHCMYKDIVVEKDGYQVSENERYVGAKVFPPIPGRYKMVVPFDFASLYPTTIIAYNIDYHTWVPPESNIPDSMCHVMEWEDHLGCSHDPKVIRKLQLTKYIDVEKEEIKKIREKRNALKDTLRKRELMSEINRKNDDLKPYIEERSELTKTIAKNPMCAKRKYRFLKEPRGVLPTIIQNCLDARKHTRKVDMKKCKEEIARLTKDSEENGTDNTELIVAQKTLLDVLDKRQLAFKVSANSMYGAMGVRRGYLPFMPGAMCTTYMGRTNIEVVAKTIPEKYGGELIYGDTDCVSPYTPVLILKDEKIYYKTVDELSDGNWSRINPNKEISKCKEGYKIWSDQGFTDIVNVVRCGIKKPVSRVLTHVGVVSCSNEHSLLRDTLESVTPEDLKQKDKLCISEFPLPEDTPDEPLYPNNLTAEKIREHVLSDEVYEDLSAELAFVWGVFFADGSCGSYKQKGGSVKHSWAITKKDNLLLERCINIFATHEPTLSFKILDTLKSTSANKLVPGINQDIAKEERGTMKAFVEKYRELFYDNRKYKKVPDIVLNAPYSIREAFFMGYYAGDGSKKDPALCLTNKGEIGTAGLFFLLRSIGYQVSINTRADKPDTYKLTGSTPKQKFRFAPNAVKKIEPYEVEEDEYIYDIQTENHHFAAGVGQLVVHNSNYIHFPHLTGAQETWDYALYVASEVTKLFPKPIELEFEEEIYSFFFILSKKRYMYRKCLRDGVVDKKIGKKGVLLARRDNSKFIRDIYETVISKIADDVHRDDILYYVNNQINELCAGVKPISDFVVTKSIGDSGGLIPEAFVNEKGVKKAKVGDYTVPILSNDKKEREEQLAKKGADSVDDYYLLCLPAQVQLAERMRMRGQRVDSGTRLEYVVCDPENHTGKQYEKIESSEYLAKHKEYINIDYMYYLKALINPLDQVLDVAYGNEKGYKKGFIDTQYKQRWKIRHKLMEELKDLFRPNLVFKD
jgi:DNA polymerase elongation subunit (family B)